MAFKSFPWALSLALASFCVAAQTPAEVPEWSEESAPPPPAYSLDKLIPIEMPRYVTLKIGIDPASVQVGTSDGVVRYVVVMRNASGSSSAAYEGIQCTKGEVKTYARADSNGHWVAIKQPEWRALTDNLPSRHAYAIAKQGGCDGRTSAKRDATIRALAGGRKTFD